jgi:hypothetical protein
MAKGITMWKAEDGRAFDTKEEALAHEFASSVVRAYGNSVVMTSPEYIILTWLYQNRVGFMDQLSPPDNEPAA